ncbi:MAG TPA: hypothetical protein VGM23_17880, partial [Armatimonadota bacterium]
LFVRGLTGTIAVIADDLRKDGQGHAYDWLAHSVVNNRIAIDGRTFCISERYGGAYIEAMESGLQCALVKQNVPNGRYRGWLLVRGTPMQSRTWSNTSVFLNGKRVPYNTTYFAQGGFIDGWFWVPIMVNGAKGDPAFDVTKGELRVDFTSLTGAQVALAVFTRDVNWTPAFTIPATGGDFVTLDINSLQQGEKPWTVANDPIGELHGVFLGKTPPQLRVDTAVSTQMPVLHAEQRTVNARYLCVMAPSEQPNIRQIELPASGGNQVAMLRSAAGVDVIGGVIDGGVTTGELATDAAAAVVSLRNAEQVQSISRYALVAGSSLRYRTRTLVDAHGQPVHIINDGTRLIVRGPGGARLQCAKLTAKSVVYNGVAAKLPAGAGDMVQLVIPPLPSTWKTTISPDGLRVTVTGDGPLPLKVNAPKAAEIAVNGVSRYFVRDEQGIDWPLLENGTERFLYSNQLKGAALKDLVEKGDTVKTVSTPRSRKEALQFPNGTATLNLKTAGPGRYRLTLGVAMAVKDTLQISLGAGHFSITGPTPDGDITVQRFDEVELRGDSAQLVIRGAKPFALTEVRLAPVLQPLAANNWMTIGPFPSPWGKQMTAENTKLALSTPFLPEQGLTFNETYPGIDGKPLGWLHTDSTNGAFMATGVNFAITNGVTRNDVCYALTYLVSPDDRSAQLQIGCDYWANAYLNGKAVQSDRAATSVNADGAQFNTPSPNIATIRLHQGVNTLLVKVQSGSGGSSFNCSITNPGDVQITAQPPAAK